MTAKSDLIPESQNFLYKMADDFPSIDVNVIGTLDGFEIIFSCTNKKTYILHTQRRKIRRFKSPSTLFNFLNEMGISNIKVSNLNLCAQDSYVRKNNNR